MNDISSINGTPYAARSNPPTVAQSMGRGLGTGTPIAVFADPLMQNESNAEPYTGYRDSIVGGTMSYNPKPVSMYGAQGRLSYGPIGGTNDITTQIENLAAMGQQENYLDTTQQGNQLGSILVFSSKTTSNIIM